MVFDQTRKSPRDIFPGPENKSTVKTNPLSFYWLPVQGVNSYTFILKNSANVVLQEVVTAENIFHLKEKLPVGTYSWDLICSEGQRGWYEFTIDQEAEDWLVPSAKDILSKVSIDGYKHLWGEKEKDSNQYKSLNLEILNANVKIALKDGIPPKPKFHLPDIEENGENDYTPYFKKLRHYIDRNLVSCSIAYFLYQDEEVKNYIRTVLLEVCSWNPEGPCAVDGPWGDEVGLSFSRCLFSVYDLTKDCFSDVEKQFIENTLIQYARQIYRRLLNTNFKSEPGKSHVGRISAYLGEASIVLKGIVEDEEAEEWLQYSLDIYGSFFPFFGGEDGGWAEGSFYASSYTKWFMPFFLLVEKYSGFTFLNKPFYQNFCHYLFHFMQPHYEVHSFCDGFWTYCIREEWQGFWAQDPFSVYADRFGDEYVSSSRERLEHPSHFDLHVFEHFFPKIYLEKHPTKQVKITNDKHFRDAGFVAMQSNIKNMDQGDSLLIRCSKYGSSSHQHADQGNFTLLKKGKALICSSGYFGRGYGDRLHTEWTKHSIAHNVPLINGVGQETNSHSSVGKVIDVISKDLYSTCVLDLSESYQNVDVYIRKIIFIRDGLVVIKDYISSENSISIDWNLHSLYKPTMEDNLFVLEGDESFTGKVYHDQFSAHGEFTDQYKLKESRDEYNTLRKQYHLTWKFEKANQHKIVGIFDLYCNNIEFDILANRFSGNDQYSILLNQIFE
ncbi:MAG: hypothetical protein COA79_15520 [Planctomycetota bacterium]|nr:MAG: hypothetical protein COA79_15520 [Planctomycetota bacterium]